MMQQSISHASFGNPAQFGIMHKKSLIAAMTIVTINDRLVERENIGLRFSRKFLNVGPFGFPLPEFSPGPNQIR